MDRLAIFLDDLSGGLSTFLLRETLRAASARSDVAVVAVCVRKHKPYHRLCFQYVLKRFRRRVRRFWADVPPDRVLIPKPLDLPRLARHGRFRVVVPSSGDFNEPTFVDELQTAVRPTMAFCLLCSQRFGPRLLETLQYPVNYHNGTLPNYRGLYATSWSLYYGEKESGYAFHRMNAEFDRGPILLEGRVPIETDILVGELEWKKTTAAAACLPQVLDLMVARVPGTPQQGEGRYFSRRDFTRIQTIENPKELSQTEIHRRLRAFGALQIYYGNRWHKVSRAEKLSRLQND